MKAGLGSLGRSGWNRSSDQQVRVGALKSMPEVAPRLVAQLERSKGFPVDRELYRHQADAIRLEAESRGENERPGLVITAGTGAGKTESFLLPVLNQLFNEQRAAGEGGIRAVILYPMNALVNDQVQRLYGWMKGQEQVTLFHFTGETPEDGDAANKSNYPQFDKSRRRTRQEARDAVPDVLVTNYSMLEYMLCRPQDSVFFGTALRAVVLDEAHLYNGTLAAEIALLLRRLMLRCGVESENVLQIATSATLGGDEEVGRFASNVFTKDISLIRWLKGETVRTPLPDTAPPPVSAQIADVIATGALEDRIFLQDDMLIEDMNLANSVRLYVKPLVGQHAIDAHLAENRPAKVLYEAMARMPLVAKLERFLWEHRSESVVPLSALAEELWSERNEQALKATSVLLQMGMRARLRGAELPLLPHKLHLLARAPRTVSACLNPKCTTLEQSRLPGGGRLVAEATERCPDCDCCMVTMCRCDRCGEALVAGVTRQDGTLNLRARWGKGEPPPKTEYVYAVLVTEGGEPFELRTRELIDLTDEQVFLRFVHYCPNCGADEDEFQPLGLTDGLALPVVAETLLSEMPVARAAKGFGYRPKEGEC